MQIKHCLNLIFIIILVSSFAYADFDMTLIATINLPDSVRIQQVGSACDFNGDGYPDLLVSIDDYPGERPEAVYLYLGGPDFDTQVDYIFRDGLSPQEYGCGYGEQVCALGDINHDGYEDFAVGAPSYDGINWETGRVYVYFGSALPDTIPDLIIEGSRYTDNMGYLLGAGDFNGDDYDDILAVAGNFPLGPRICIYLGGDNPDTVSDMQYDYSYPSVIYELYAGSDLNNDGYEEFGWYYDNGSRTTCTLFLGNNPIPASPNYSIDNCSFSFLYGDISGDSQDDFIRLYGAYYLCLGGDNFDIEPDYYIWSDQAEPYIFPVSGMGNMLLKQDGWDNNFAIYYPGIPFDTIPAAVFYYDEGSLNRGLFIGDINSDGNTDMVVPFLTDQGPLPYFLRVYSIIATGIDDEEAAGLPEDYQLLTCYPNPFNSSTVISYTNLEVNDIDIYDITGRLVKSFNCNNGAESRIIWDGTDSHGQPVASGVYLAKIAAGQKTLTRKLVLQK